MRTAGGGFGGDAGGFGGDAGGFGDEDGGFGGDEAEVVNSVKDLEVMKT